MELAKVLHIHATECTPESTVLEAIRLMAADKSGVVVIVSAQKEVQGIFTEHDNMTRVTMCERDPNATRLAEVMTAPVTIAKGEVEVDEALTTMIRNRFSCLPVINFKNRLIGVVSLRDLLMRRIGQKEIALQTLEAFACAGGPG